MEIWKHLANDKEKVLSVHTYVLLSCQVTGQRYSILFCVLSLIFRGISPSTMFYRLFYILLHFFVKFKMELSSFLRVFRLMIKVVVVVGLGTNPETKLTAQLMN